MARPPQVLLLTNDVDSRQKWTEILQPVVDLCAAPCEASPGASQVPEVVVTDHLPLAEPAGRFGAFLVRGEIGVIGVAAPGAADVQLPVDYTGRELRLACCLLAQIVRLRRQRGRDRRAHRALEQLAHRDPLTGLANRRAWNAILTNRLTEPAGQPAPRLCVGLLDLDHFKQVNDRFGHGVGDETLQTVARRLRRDVRSQDVVARLGGDEFALLLADIDSTDARAAIDRIRRSAAHRVEGPDGNSLELTLTAGFVALPSDYHASAGEIMTAVDRFLLQGKAEGRDRSVGELLARVVS